MSMQRIAIVGCGGGGKSTLARAMGDILGLPVIHLDRLFWKAGWRPTDFWEWRDLQEELTRRERWVMDGNYSATIDVRLRAADTIILLDLPPWFCLWRVLKRAIRRERRPDIPDDCPERLMAKSFWQFLWWVWRFPWDRRPSLLARIDFFGQGKRVIHLRSPAQIERFLQTIRRTPF